MPPCGSQPNTPVVRFAGADPTVLDPPREQYSAVGGTVSSDVDGDGDMDVVTITHDGRVVMWANCLFAGVHSGPGQCPTNRTTDDALLFHTVSLTPITPTEGHEFSLVLPFDGGGVMLHDVVAFDTSGVMHVLPNTAGSVACEHGATSGGCASPPIVEVLLESRTIQDVGATESLHGVTAVRAAFADAEGNAVGGMLLAPPWHKPSSHGDGAPAWKFIVPTVPSANASVASATVVVTWSVDSHVSVFDVAVGAAGAGGSRTVFMRRPLLPSIPCDVSQAGDASAGCDEAVHSGCDRRVVCGSVAMLTPCAWWLQIRLRGRRRRVGADATGS